jgi:hypothetical protein
LYLKFLKVADHRISADEKLHFKEGMVTEEKLEDI